MDNSPVAGDVLLFRGGPKNPAIWAQWALRVVHALRRSGRVQISHAAICVCTEGIIESQPEGGVQLTRWASLKGRENSILAFRPNFAPSIAVDGRAAYLLGRPYNRLFDLHKHIFDFEEWEQPFFCSEILDEFFTRKEFGLLETGSIYPDDLLRLRNNDRWSDVSEVYVNAIKRSEESDQTPILDAIQLMSDISLMGIKLELGRIPFDRPELFNARKMSLIAKMQARDNQAMLESIRAMEMQLRRHRRFSWLRSWLTSALFRRP